MLLVVNFLILNIFINCEDNLVDLLFMVCILLFFLIFGFLFMVVVFILLVF